MKDLLKSLFDNNRTWASKVLEEDPEFFQRLSAQQAPEYLWIGCSDSRVPANQIAGILPGEIFVHRNIANLVVPSDLNCLAVMQFAIDVLKVKHILVVGHYGCSGVKAAIEGVRLGLVDHWLLHIRHTSEKYRSCLDKNSPDYLDRLCELNVIEQVINVCHSPMLKDAWLRQQNIAVHGFIYGIGDGLLRNLNVSIENETMLEATYQNAVKAVLKKGFSSNTCL